jgi:hypothetical protein
MPGCVVLLLNLTLVLLTMAQLARPPERFKSDDLAEPPEFKNPGPPASPTPPPLGGGFQSDANQNRVWKCSKCNAVIGTGPHEPKVEVCTHCSAKLTSRFNYWIIGGVGGAIAAALLWAAIFAGRGNHSVPSTHAAP